MKLIVIGINHKIAPVRIREKFSFTKKLIHESLIKFKDSGFVSGAIILSTCNRVEIYATTPNAERGVKALKEFLSNCQKQELSTIEPHLYTYIGKEAIRHLFKVTAGLDSQILGENQILGQVAFAYEEARVFEATGKLLDMVFEGAIKVSRNLHAETDISKDALSIADIVIELIKTRIGSMIDKKVLIVGVGKISELIIRNLKREKVKAVFVANRTYERARELAGQIGAEVVGFEELKDRLKEADIVISATSSPHLVIKKEMLEETSNHKLIIIDLALPRDVDPRARELKRVELFNLDDLDVIIRKVNAQTKSGISRAEAIIDKEADAIWERLIRSGREQVLLR